MFCFECEYDKNCSVQDSERDILGCMGHSKRKSNCLSSLLMLDYPDGHLFGRRIYNLLKEKGLPEDYLEWYSLFMEFAYEFLKHECNPSDQTFESIIKLCKCTQVKREDNRFVFDFMLDEWLEKIKTKREDFEKLCSRNMPENPEVILQEIYEEMKRDVPETFDTGNFDRKCFL